MEIEIITHKKYEYKIPLEEYVYDFFYNNHDYEDILAEELNQLIQNCNEKYSEKYEYNIYGYMNCGCLSSKKYDGMFLNIIWEKRNLRIIKKVCKEAIIKSLKTIIAINTEEMKGPKEEANDYLIKTSCSKCKLYVICINSGKQCFTTYFPPTKYCDNYYEDVLKEFNQYKKKRKKAIEILNKYINGKRKENKI